MKVELISYSNLGEKVCGIASKTCVSKNIPDVDDNVMKSLRSAISSGHEAVLEHFTMTFAIEGVSRALLAQLSRHRLMSLDVQSQRYVDMDGFDYVVPESILNHPDSLEQFKWGIKAIQKVYKTLLAYGIDMEDARYILPNAACTNVVVSVNARELRHIAGLRMCVRAQQEIRELVTKMVELAKEVAPTIFENAGPSCVQMGYCPEGKRGCGRAMTLGRMLDIVDEQRTAEGGRH